MQFDFFLRDQKSGLSLIERILRTTLNWDDFLFISSMWAFSESVNSSGDAGQRGGPSYAPPSANIAQQTPPPYLPDPSPPAPSYLPEFRPQPSYNTHAQKYVRNSSSG